MFPLEKHASKKQWFFITNMNWSLLHLPTWLTCLSGKITLVSYWNTTKVQGKALCITTLQPLVLIRENSFRLTLILMQWESGWENRCVRPPSTVNSWVLPSIAWKAENWSFLDSDKKGAEYNILKFFLFL